MSRFRRAVALPSLLLFSLAYGGGQKLARQERIEEMQPEVASTRPASSSATGVYHILRQGQTLYSVARAYGVPLESLATINGITDPTSIPAGKALFVPGARRPLDIKLPFLPALEWPISGRITSAFENDGGRPTHEGIDIRGAVGQEVRSAGPGRVIQTGTERGYGMMVIIEHGGGLSTLYAHASKILVQVDETVDAGDPVALVGESGNARGAHLHFEVRRDGRPVNPLPFLGSNVAEARR